MSKFVVTIRHGPQVEREQHETLDDALAALRGWVVRVQAEDDLPEVRMLRTFTPEQRVKARIEISAGRIFRRREAGLDVMGDGAIVSYLGGALKKPLDIDGSDASEHCDAIAEALRE